MRSSENAKMNLFLAVTLLSSMFLTTSAQAGGYYSPPQAEVAQTIVQKQIFNHGFRTVTTDLDDVSNCGLWGTGTLVEVQALHPVAEGSKVESFETIRSYVVDQLGKMADAEACAKH